jgi:hypothetical protein
VTPREQPVDAGDNATGVAGPDDGPVREPATAQQAADILDLRSIALVEGAQEPTRRCIAGLSYQVKADSQQAFDFHRRMLIDDGWTELPGTRNDSGYASGTFSREGFVVSLSTSPTGRPDQPGEVNVSITNHGNTNLKRLPVPPGVKPFYTTPASIAYLTDAAVDQTTQAVRQLLLDGGWKPYGSAGDSYFFKQNAVQISARIMSAPAQQGRTVITYSSEQYSYDLPAPEEAIGLQYTDSLRQLFFDHPGTLDDVVAYYRRELEPLGWKSTTENPVKMGFKMFLIFRDPRKDMLTMETHPFEGKTRVLIKHQTAEEVARLERKRSSGKSSSAINPSRG